MKLICFPYAGATAASFMKWKKNFDEIQIIPIDPPGRGKRMAEPLYKTIKEMVDDVNVQLLMLIHPDEPYAVYGHSMGSIITFELLHELLKTEFPMPVHIFLSGRNPPHFKVEKPIYQLDDDEFIKKILEMGGMEAQFFENPLLAKMFLPILRADLEALDNYRYEKKKQQLPVDMTFFFASDDGALDIHYITQWNEYISGSFQMYSYTGGHFFIFNHEEEITKIIQETLSDNQEIIAY